MKKILSLSLLLGAATLTSCKFEVEDYFDEEASLRIEHTAKEINGILVDGSAENQNGWVMQYFVSGTDEQNFEGFNLFARFRSNGTVLFASDHRYLRNDNANKYTEAVSLYDMILEEGPIISFNTWNDVFSPFVDPVNPLKAPSTISKDGVGMGGDVNLIVTSYSKDEILLRGERHGTRSRLIRCDRPWQQYINDTKELKASITNENVTDYLVTSGRDTMYISNLRRGFFSYKNRLIDPIKNKTLSCVFTPTGFRLERADSIGNSLFQELYLSEDKTKLVSEDGKVECRAMWDTYIATKELWIIDNSTLNDKQKQLCSQIETLVRNAYPSFSFRGIGIGKSKGKDAVNGIVLVFYKNATKNSCISAGIEMSIALTAQATESISSNGTNFDYNMGVIEKAAPGIKELATTLSQTFAGTYSLIPDNHFNPTEVTFENASGAKYVATKDNNRIVIE